MNLSFYSTCHFGNAWPCSNLCQSRNNARIILLAEYKREGSNPVARQWKYLGSVPRLTQVWARSCVSEMASTVEEIISWKLVCDYILSKNEIIFYKNFVRWKIKLITSPIRLISDNYHLELSVLNSYGKSIITVLLKLWSVIFLRFWFYEVLNEIDQN